MKKIFLITFLSMSFGFCLFGQATSVDYEKDIKPLNDKIRLLQDENNKLKTSLKRTSDSLSKAITQLDTLQKQTEANTSAIAEASKELGIKISETGKTTDKKITEVNESLSKNTLYWIIAFLATALLSGLIYFLLGKRIKTDKSDVEEQISKTKKSLEEEGIKLDTKLTEVLETQLKLVQAEKNITSTTATTEDADHSLALKVADEIMRLNKNISNMDGNIKGLKQLAASVKRIEDNFAANGYEMPDLLNKSFDARMKVIVANSIPDENLKSGEEIITRIIKPQVNFKGVMIQAAQVEVSVGQ